MRLPIDQESKLWEIVNRCLKEHHTYTFNDREYVVLTNRKCVFPYQNWVDECDWDTLGGSLEFVKLRKN